MDLPNLDPGVWLIIIVAMLLMMAGSSGKSRAKSSIERRRVTIETIDSKTGQVLRTEVGMAIEQPTTPGKIGTAARAPRIRLG